MRRFSEEQHWSCMKALDLLWEKGDEEEKPQKVDSPDGTRFRDSCPISRRGHLWISEVLDGMIR